ncbi:MAG: hypothetical protein ACOVSW_20300 [Candidatus Kapaibacteriota bacterium]|jgi:hypothetical protein
MIILGGFLFGAGVALLVFRFTARWKTQNYPWVLPSAIALIIIGIACVVQDFLKGFADGFQGK